MTVQQVWARLEDGCLFALVPEGLSGKAFVLGEKRAEAYKSDLRGQGDPVCVSGSLKTHV